MTLVDLNQSHLDEANAILDKITKVIKASEKCKVDTYEKRMRPFRQWGVALTMRNIQNPSRSEYPVWDSISRRPAAGEGTGG